MAKPRLIILVRHAQSEGNKNREIHQTIPDHRVKLTPDGWTQAYDAGRRLRNLLRADDTLHFFTSPYRRTRETTEGILATLTSDEQEPSPFKRSNITVHEEPRLREQDFGNFQPCSAEMERMWQERADYGHFFYRIPNGESAADAYDRVSGFNESLWRQFGDEDFASVCVLVTHGLMSRVFLMKWYHFTVEYFEDLRNVNHCEFLIMRKKEDSGKYLLENKLRTWSELRRERALLGKENGDKDGKQAAAVAAAAPLDKAKSFVATRRWGGCPNGCNHQSHYKRRDDLEALRRSDEITAQAASPVVDGHADGVVDGIDGILSRLPLKSQSQSHSQTPSVSSLASRRPAGKLFHQGYSSEDDTDSIRGARPSRLAPSIDVTGAAEEVVSSPDGTPSYISAEDRLRSLASPGLHIGRDGGGTYSGHASPSNSDAGDHSHSEDEARPLHRQNQQQQHHHCRQHPRHLQHHKSKLHKHEGVASLAAHLKTLPIDANDRGEDVSRGGGSGSEAADEGHSDGKGPVMNLNTREAKTREDTRLNGFGMRPGSRANRLGDVHSSDVGSEADYDDDLAKAEKRDRSIQGSVY